MSQDFLTRFLAGQRAKGQDQTSVFAVLERLQFTGAATDRPTAPPSVTLKSVQLPAPVIAVPVTATLTACIERAECPATARRIYRRLFEIGLQTVRARGLPKVPDVAVFHLPLELLAAHLEVSRETVWRNLKSLKVAGLLDERDHYGTLRGQSSVTGKVWAVSLRPERQLSRQADPVRVKAADLKFPWRDLDADVLLGRTAYNLTRTGERQAHDAAKNAEREPERAEARARAKQRAEERRVDQRRGKKPLTGRQAATVNAAQTRAARAELPIKAPVQQSMQRSLEHLSE